MASQFHHEEHLQKSLETFDSIVKHQTRSLHHLVKQYESSKFSRDQLIKSLNILNSTLLKGGKVVISGIGKSHKIAAKTVATLVSLGINSALLHPSEALHGDLGILRRENNDCLILISSSGKTPELIQLLPHISSEIPIVLLTNKKKSLLASHFQVKSLLYAELPSNLKEEAIYGLNAPTISTTLCLTLADAVSISLAELYVSDINERKKIFGERHPGGAIGEQYSGSTSSSKNNSVFSTSFSLTSLCSRLSQSMGSRSGSISNDGGSLPTSGETQEEAEEEEDLEPTPVVFEVGYEANVVNYELSNEVYKSNKAFYHDGSYFKDEMEAFQKSVLYDYVVFKYVRDGEEDLLMAISTDKLKDLIRMVHEHEYSSAKERFSELKWRVGQELSRIKI